DMDHSGHGGLPGVEATAAVTAAARPVPSGRDMNPRTWVSATFAGWTVGFVLALACIVAAESAGLRETQFPLALGMGAGVGIAQGRLLAPWFSGRWAWATATAAGL